MGFNFRVSKVLVFYRYEISLFFLTLISVSSRFMSKDFFDFEILVLLIENSWQIFILWASCKVNTNTPVIKIGNSHYSE